MARTGRRDTKRSSQTRLPLLILMLTLSACLCQQPASGRGARDKQEPAVRRATEKEPIAGGFSEIGVEDPAAKEAYAFLREELGSSHPDIRLETVKRAFRQIVAGTNIRLECRYRIPPGKADHELTATVYFDLAGGRSLRGIVFGEDEKR